MGGNFRDIFTAADNSSTKVMVFLNIVTSLLLYISRPHVLSRVSIIETDGVGKRLEDQRWRDPVESIPVRSFLPRLVPHGKVDFRVGQVLFGQNVRQVKQKDSGPKHHAEVAERACSVQGAVDLNDEPAEVL